MLLVCKQSLRPMLHCRLTCLLCKHSPCIMGESFAANLHYSTQLSCHNLTFKCCDRLLTVLCVSARLAVSADDDVSYHWNHSASWRHWCWSLWRQCPQTIPFCQQRVQHLCKAWHEVWCESRNRQHLWWCFHHLKTLVCLFCSFC